jgi:hypothetical protein
VPAFRDADGTAAVKWAAAVDRHISHCKAFAKNYRLDEASVIEQGFASRVWASLENGEQGLTWVQAQWGLLGTARRNYAAAAITINEKATAIA